MLTILGAVLFLQQCRDQMMVREYELSMKVDGFVRLMFLKAVFQENSSAILAVLPLQLVFKDKNRERLFIS